AGIIREVWKVIGYEFIGTSFQTSVETAPSQVMRGKAPARQSLALPIECTVVFGRATLCGAANSGRSRRNASPSSRKASPSRQFGSETMGLASTKAASRNYNIL